jgi:LPS export ABC transporter protein LptC
VVNLKVIMVYPFLRFNTLSRITVLFVIVIIVLSCENKIDFIPKSDLLTLPSITTRNFSTVYTDSGKLQLVLSSPLLEQYDNKDLSYSEFRSGIKVVFFDGKKAPVGSVNSKYAKYTNKDNLWELRDSVVVINEDNEKLETELLFWNQKNDLIYTDRFFKITNPDQVTQGFGFESNSRLNNRKLKKVNAIIYLKDQE